MTGGSDWVSQVVVSRPPGALSYAGYWVGLVA